MRRSLEQAAGIVVLALLALTLLFSVNLMLSADSDNVNLINALLRQGRVDETIPLRVANSQLRVGMAQGLLSVLLLAVTVYYAWQTRLLVRGALPARLRTEADRTTGPHVAVDDLVGSAEIAQRLSGGGVPLVKDWRKRHPDFPAPVLELQQGPLWRWSDVEAWARATGRLD